MARASMVVTITSTEGYDVRVWADEDTAERVMVEVPETEPASVGVQDLRDAINFVLGAEISREVVAR